MIELLVLVVCMNACSDMDIEQLSLSRIDEHCNCFERQFDGSDEGIKAINQTSQENIYVMCPDVGMVTTER